jgi:hypothetical protein
VKDSKAIDIVRQGLKAAEEKGGTYIGSRTIIRQLIREYDEEAKKNTVLEANMFRGIDPRGRTNMSGFLKEVREQMDETESLLVDNDVLIAAMGRHQA